MPATDIIFDKFNWAFGVVEDRHDPLKLGRLKVRFYGIHTEDAIALPTKDLPWATVVNPINSAATSGVGGPVTGAVEGTWVIGFFIDQESFQKPVVLGTIAGLPTEANPKDPTLGFFDPNGKYPRDGVQGFNSINESDVSRLARGAAAETHKSLMNRRTQRIQGIPKPIAAGVKSVQPDKGSLTYEREFFAEPTPRGYGPSADYPSKYPYNHVRETESGHVFEVDDTPGAERINTQHRTGTYEEIVADGTRTVKVVGSDYEIIVKDKNVFVNGSMNLTVTGDLNLKVAGNMVTEVSKDHVTLIRGDKIEKIVGNHITEIMSDRNTQLNGNNSIRISGSDLTTIEGSEKITIGGTKDQTIMGDESKTNVQNYKQITPANFTVLAKGTVDMAAVGNFSMASSAKVNVKAVGDMNITTDANQNVTVAGNQTEGITGTQSTTASVSNINNDVNITGTSTATVDHVSNGISGHDHLHGGVASGSAKTGVPE